MGAEGLFESSYLLKGRVPMKQLIWKIFAPLVDAAITMRLLQFHEALVRRGQIADKPEAPPGEH